MDNQDERDRVREELNRESTPFDVSFEYAAPDALHAIIYLLGIVQDPDPGMRQIKFIWTVTNRKTGEVEKLKYSLDELEAIAKRENQEMMDNLKGGRGQNG